MKQVIAIFFALTLILGQPLAMVATCCPKNVEACCDCGGKMKCCLAESGNPAPATPAVPAPNLVPKDFQGAFCLVAQLIQALPAVDHAIAPVSSACFIAGAVPLFARDCAYLL